LVSRNSTINGFVKVGELSQNSPVGDANVKFVSEKCFKLLEQTTVRRELLFFEAPLGPLSLDFVVLTTQSLRKQKQSDEFV